MIETVAAMRGKQVTACEKNKQRNSIFLAKAYIVQSFFGYLLSKGIGDARWPLMGNPYMSKSLSHVFQEHTTCSNMSNPAKAKRYSTSSSSVNRRTAQDLYEYNQRCFGKNKNILIPYWWLKPHPNWNMHYPPVTEPIHYYHYPAKVIDPRRHIDIPVEVRSADNQWYTNMAPYSAMYERVDEPVPSLLPGVFSKDQPKQVQYKFIGPVWLKEYKWEENSPYETYDEKSNLLFLTYDIKDNSKKSKFFEDGKRKLLV